MPNTPVRSTDRPHEKEMRPVPDIITEMEARLDSFERGERDEALAELLKLVNAGRIELPAPTDRVNLHAHTFYSYNALGYSPTHIVWRARREGLAVIGIVDFDVFDGIDEFFAAADALGIKAVAGMETRAYIPEFATREITSPGEPGITYHMGVGFTQSVIPAGAPAAFAEMLRTNARNRNMAMVERVNAYLDPVALDYAADVLPLSPSGTPTERHLCAAYEAKAQQVFPDPVERTNYWADRLGTPADEMETIAADSRSLQALIRSRTMKRGGVGYMKPTPETFPLMTDVNDFVLSIGGIPTMTWLDGTSAGEQDIAELLDLQMAAGVTALNIIPDRNWNIADPDVKATKVANLYKIVELAAQRDLPLVVGTEMNAPGLKFVDTFDAPELAGVVDAFRRGAFILAGHTRAAREGRGYLSDWAKAEFGTVAAKNDFFYNLGRS